MNRKEKIKYLEGFSNGREVAKNLFPPEVLEWRQDAGNSESFRWGESTLLQREPTPKSNERNIINEYSYYCPLEIRQDED
jgi:hypothetical protein